MTGEGHDGGQAGDRAADTAGDQAGDWEQAGSTMTSAPRPARSGRSSTRLVVGALAAVAILGIVVVAAVLSASFAPLEDAAADLVPADAPVYVSVYLDPSGGQKAALRDLLARLRVDDDRGDDPIEAVRRALDAPLSRIGLDYDDDVRPWLGRQVAFFLTAPAEDTAGGDGAVLLATTDAEASRAAVARAAEARGLAEATAQRTHAGTTYDVVATEAEDIAYGIVGGFLAVGTEAGVQAVIDAAGSTSLAGTEAFRRAVADLPDDHLLRYYVDTAGFVDQLGSELTAGGTRMLDRVGMADQDPTAGVLFALEDGVVLEASASVAAEGPGRDIARSFAGTAPLGRLPGGAWLAFAVPDLGELAAGYLDILGAAAGTGADGADLEAEFARETGVDLRGDVLSWMGSAGVFVRGREPLALRGGLVVDSVDGEASRALVAEAEGLLAGYGIPTSATEVAELSGFAVQPPGIPVEVLVVAGSGDGGERVVVAAGREAARDAIAGDEPLADADDFRAATAALDGRQPVFYLDVAVVVDLVERALGGLPGGLPAEYREEVEPYVDRLVALVAGVSVDGDRISQRVVLTVRAGDGAP